MKTIAPIFILLTLFTVACKTTTSVTKEKPIDNFGTAEYYQKYQRNIDRFYNMIQGTFICYSKEIKGDGHLDPWKVGSDSVITYSVPIKDPAKEGYWLICYQFMTSLPDAPIYSAIQRITPIDRDTFLSEFFEPPAGVILTEMIKDLDRVSESINLETLVRKDEYITYYREEVTLFKGFSNIYKDFQNQYLTYRRENYQISPMNSNFATQYFQDKEGTIVLNRTSSTSVEIRTQKKVEDMIDKSFLE